MKQKILSCELKCLEIGEIENFERVKADIKRAMRGRASNVRQYGHPTNWTKPHGKVEQYNLFADSSDSTITVRGFTTHPHIQALIEKYKPINLRINILGSDSGLSQHRETIKVGNKVKARFHAVIETNPEATVFLDGDNYHLEEGKIYYFNNGCTHSATNAGNTDRVHLVWDVYVHKFINDLLKSGKELEPLYPSPILHSPLDSD